ncbi:MAG: hypothetical protein O3C40_05845 [Planctomycetota bacterium]|nr:hypothetical protein [Planctomycetota bacterium]
MSSSHQVETHFSGIAETPELEDYRPLSPLVIGACIASLASFLAIVHPLLWVVPVVAIVVSVTAIVRVSAAQSRYSGGRVAVIALCIAVLSGAYAPARTISRERALYARAQEKNEQWLSLVQLGRVQEAHQFMKNAYDRFQGPGSLARHYEDVPRMATRLSREMEMEGMRGELGSAAQLKEFVQQPVPAALLRLGEHARIEHLQDVTILRSRDGMKITQRFRVSGFHDGQPESLEFLIRATRQELSENATWSVGEFQLVE